MHLLHIGSDLQTNATYGTIPTDQPLDQSHTTHPAHGARRHCYKARIICGLHQPAEHFHPACNPGYWQIFGSGAVWRHFSGKRILQHLSHMCIGASLVLVRSSGSGGQVGNSSPPQTKLCYFGLSIQEGCQPILELDNFLGMQDLPYIRAV